MESPLQEPIPDSNPVDSQNQLTDLKESSSSSALKSPNQSNPSPTTFNSIPDLKSDSTIETGSNSIPTDPNAVRLAIKCPSLDQDPATINVTRQTTVRQIKSIVQGTWPGKPSLEGMRCISAGRLLTDDDLVGDITANTDSIPTASLHLVIRPDAWSSPPTQFSNPLIQSATPQVSHQNSLPGTPPDVLANSPYFGAPTVARTAAPFTSTSIPSSRNLVSPETSPTSVGVVPNPSSVPTLSTFSPSNQFPTFTPINEPQTLLTPEKAISKLLEKIASTEYDLVKEMLLVGHGCYFERYRNLWKELYPNLTDGDQEGGNKESSSEKSEEEDREKERSLRVLERDILDWPELPTSIVSEGEGLGGISPTYQQVTINGLPYLLRVHLTPKIEESSALLHEYYTRMIVLQRLCLKMDRMIGYARMGSLLGTGGSFQFSSASTMTPLQQQQQLMTLDPQARAQAIQGLQSLQRRIAAVTQQQVDAQGRNIGVAPGTATTLTPAQREQARRRNRRFFPHPADMARIFTPVLFLCFKVSILLYVISRNASMFKQYFLCATAALYVTYQANLLLRRQRRLRHATERARRVAAGGMEAGDRLARRMAQRRPAAPGANAAHRPAAAPAAGPPNPAAPNAAAAPGPTLTQPAAPADWSADPFAPPPPLYAPARHRASSPSSAAWWLEQIAYAGMAREDMQLGLLPPRPAANAAATANQGRSILQIIFPFAFPDQNQARQHPPSSLGPLDFLPTFLLALLLFVGTLNPEIELMRRKAVDERENVIRVAARKEEERKEKREEIMKKREEDEKKRLEEIEATKKEAEERKTGTEEVKESIGEEEVIDSSASTSSIQLQTAASSTSQTLPVEPTPPQVLTSEYSERVLRGETLRGGVRPGAELDISAEHEAARAAEAANDNTDTDGADGEDEAAEEGDAEEDMGFF